MMPILACPRQRQLSSALRTQGRHRVRSEMCQQRKWPTLFDHLVGSGEHGRRHGKAEGLSGLEIDDQFELGGLHNAAEGASGARRHSGTGNSGVKIPARIRLRADWIAVILALSARLPAMDDRHHRSSPEIFRKHRQSAPARMSRALLSTLHKATATQRIFRETGCPSPRPHALPSSSTNHSAIASPGSVRHPATQPCPRAARQRVIE